MPYNGLSSLPLFYSPDPFEKVLCRDLKEVESGGDGLRYGLEQVLDQPIALIGIQLLGILEDTE